jgi:hypothetical protein
MSAAIAGKLYALAEKRCVYFFDLYTTGRWTRFYSADEFVACMREAVRLAEISRSMLDAAHAADEGQPSMSVLLDALPAASSS